VPPLEYAPMPLNDAVCKNAKPQAKPQKLSDAHGLYLEISPAGGKYWRLKYRHMGKEKRLALGVYPDVSLLKAREKREEARKRLAEGIDPSHTKKETKRVSLLNAENTFEVIAREWHEVFLERWTERHAKNILQRLSLDIFPRIGQRPVKDYVNPAFPVLTVTFKGS
jgi:hypothetical protein